MVESLPEQPEQDDWRPRLLYTALIGMKDRDGNPIPTRTFAAATTRFCNSLKSKLGGYTSVKMHEAGAETRFWGRETTKLVFVITDDGMAADTTFKEEAGGNGSLRHLNQDEIWIIRQPIAVLMARFPR